MLVVDDLLSRQVVTEGFVGPYGFEVRNFCRRFYGPRFRRKFSFNVKRNSFYTLLGHRTTTQGRTSGGEVKVRSERNLGNFILFFHNKIVPE